MQARRARDIAAMLAMGVGCSAVIVWLVTGKLSTIEVAAISVGAYGLGVISSRFTVSLFKRLKRSFNNELDDDHH
jgi:hypothetical protein